MKPPKLASILWGILFLLFLFAGIKESQASLPEFVNDGLECEDVLPDTLEVVICEGEAIALSPGSGFDTYLWSTGQSTVEIIVSQSGLYGVTVTYQDTCEDMMIFNVLPEDPVQVTIGGDNTLCTGGSATLVAETSDQVLSYLWSTNETTQEITINSPGIYCVTITTLAGCEYTDCIEVLLEEIEVVIGGTPYICGDTPATLEVLETYASIIWSIGETTATIEVSEMGLYSVTVIDENGCIGTSEAVVTKTLEPFIVWPTLCLEEGDPLPNLECEPFNCQFTLPDGTPVDTFMGTGEYCVHITSPFDPCEWVQCGMIYGTYEVDIVGPQNYCEGDTITICALGGFIVYLWSTGETYECINVDEAGTYCVTVIDQNGCTGNGCFQIFSIEDPPDGVIDTIITPDSGNGDGSIILVFDNNNPPLIQGWEVVDSNSIGLFDIPAGTYSVTLTNQSGCSSELTFTIDLVNAVSEPLYWMENIRIFPNPTEDNWTLKLPGFSSANTFSLALYTPQGAMVRSLDLNKPEMVVKGIDLSPGIYFLTILEHDEVRMIHPLIRQ